MKTTLIIPDHLMRELKHRAAARGVTLSAMVTECLTKGLADAKPERPIKPLPAHRMGVARVDLSDRDALERVMES